MMNFQNLRKIENEEILDCFNLSFSDYSIPFKLSLKQFEAKLRTENINKDISIGTFNEKKLVGFVLHGDRNKGENRVAYNAGTGVIPTERGQNITRRMYDYIIPTLKANKFSEVVLEVISDNLPAIKSYEAIGFNLTRGLSCFKGEPFIKRKNNEIKIKQLTKVNFDELSKIGEINPTWQNCKETISNLGDNALYFLAFMGEKLCGYCILNTSNNRILQIAVKKQMRNKLIGSTILQFVKSKVSAPISIINIDSRFEETLKFFESRNLQKTLTQNEMKLEIAIR